MDHVSVCPLGIRWLDTLGRDAGDIGATAIWREGNADVSAGYRHGLKNLTGGQIDDPNLVRTSTGIDRPVEATVWSHRASGRKGSQRGQATGRIELAPVGQLPDRVGRVGDGGGDGRAWRRRGKP